MSVKALTLHQPWASLVALPVKRIETRSWSTKYRGRLYIHAARSAPATFLFLPTVVPALVVPITDHADIGDPECIVAHDDGTLDHCIPTHAPPPGPSNIVHLDAPEISDGVHLIRDITDQRPYGDFTPGRFAWLLEDVRPVDPPVPCRGRQGLWTVPDDVLAQIEGAAA